jgi:(R,R)-butanediol dehydrogenase/meso-butanediol dehydrogenase/diacetyl reductase
MRALRWHGPRDLRLTELIEPSLQPGELRVSVAYCGICGSDLHEYANGPHAIPVENPHPLSHRKAPLTLGHEFCGTVVESAQTGVKVGTPVAIEPEYRCGECDDCRAGRYNLCRHMGFIGLMGDGGMADTAVVPAYAAHPLPEAVSLRQAAVFEPAAVSLHAVRRSSLQAGDACVVFGLGPIGLLLVALLRKCGAGRIVAVDVDLRRLDRAGALGASHTVDARRADPVQAVLAATGGRGAAVAFEAVGSQATLDGCLRAVRKGGEVMLVGLMGEARLDAFDMVNRELRLNSSVGYRDVYPTLIDWTARGEFDPSAIVTRVVGLQDAVPRGFEALMHDKAQVKVLVTPQAMLAEDSA